ncbi:MAG: aldolase [Alphaproteobacteria bacterium]|nr:aldolase [Alphaproteobacteria bacterium]
MRANPVKAKLARGEAAFGTMIFEFLSPGLPQILAGAGAEFVLYDMEHSGFGLQEMKEQFALCRGLGLVPVVRPPGKDYQYAARLLDLGAMGLMFQMVESAEEAAKLVAWTRYPPHGVRGAMFGGAHDDYGGGAIADTMAKAHERTLILALIETAKGVANVEEIMAVPGIDVAHLGHADLSLSMGIPGDFANPKLQAAIDRLLAACQKHGKPAACLAANAKTGRDWMARGFKMVSYSYDIALIADGLRSGIAGLRGNA